MGKGRLEDLQRGQTGLDLGSFDGSDARVVSAIEDVVDELVGVNDLFVRLVA